MIFCHEYTNCLRGDSLNFNHHKEYPFQVYEIITAIIYVS